MRFGFVLILLWGCAACGVSPQSPSEETVAAFEVPLATATDRAAFIAVLRNAAQVEGGHVDAASDGELHATAKAVPLAKMSIHANVWQGAGDEVSWATIMDQADHIGFAWIAFARGKDERRASRFRERVMHDIAVRWPDTLSLPIIDHRTIPLRRDLIRTSAGYRLNPAAASKYDFNRKAGG